MYWQFYLRMGLVYVPTTAMIQRGFYKIIEPVAVVPASDNDAVRRALSETIARGNPQVPAPDPSDRSPPFLTKYAGVKNWSSFVRNAFLWGIDDREEKFKIIAYRKDTPNGWVRDESRCENFASKASVEKVIDRMISILQETTRNESTKR
jgi:hypothetical protein